jgi:U32 family peptidase
VKRKIELLAPGGDVDCIKAAILAGADAVYCGLDKFNARNRAANISFDDLQGILRLAHKNNCQVFLTLNIIFVDSEFPALVILLNKLANIGIDGIIAQDLGLLYILSKYFRNLEIHASTQLTTHNDGQLGFLSELNASRVNLSRELNINEIKTLTASAAEQNISTEVFVHGSNCISFSGLCYMSSVQGGNSGNRGRCSQPCRDRYLTTDLGKNHPLNLKDKSAYFILEDLINAGVASLKIEGRIKKADYVFTVVDAYRKQLDRISIGKRPSESNEILYKVFNRDFSSSFLRGNIHKDMFIDDPRDHSIQHLSEIKNYTSGGELEKDQMKLYEEKEKIKADVERKINQVSIGKAPLMIKLSGRRDSPLTVSVNSPAISFVVHSEIKLSNKGAQVLSSEIILKRFKAFNETGFYIKGLSLENLEGKLFLPFKEITSLKNKIMFILNDSQEMVAPLELPVLGKPLPVNAVPGLSVLISSEEDIGLCAESKANIYFQLPNCFKNKLSGLIDLFSKNEKLFPWFPSILIGDDYASALEFLRKSKPKLIVTNNSGIAYEAYKLNVPWIAGPYLNIANSYSLIALKEEFNCCGAFVSNELGKNQIRNILKPDDFSLFYSIYHPIALMTSRQCLFHQVTACEKNKIDGNCIQDCMRTASITNLT